MEPAAFAPAAPPLNVSVLGEALALSLVGGSGAWGGETPHPSPARQVMCVLVGALEVRASDGTARTLRPGNLLLLEDTSGKGHSSRFLSEEVVLAAVRLTGVARPSSHGVDRAMWSIVARVKPAAKAMNKAASPPGDRTRARLMPTMASGTLTTSHRAR